MTHWNSNMDEAPRDGRTIQAKIPGYGSKNMIAWTDGLLNDEQQACGGWYYIEESGRIPPECWTDGVCWGVNAELVKSVDPVAWRLPQPPIQGDEA